MNLEKEILSSLKGELIWNGVKTEVLLPLSKLDLICIHNKEYDEINICMFNLVNNGSVFCINEKYHINMRYK